MSVFDPIVWSLSAITTGQQVEYRCSPCVECVARTWLKNGQWREKERRRKRDKIISWEESCFRRKITDIFAAKRSTKKKNVFEPQIASHFPASFFCCIVYLPKTVLHRECMRMHVNRKCRAADKFFLLSCWKYLSSSELQASLGKKNQSLLRTPSVPALYLHFGEKHVRETNQKQKMVSNKLDFISFIS